MDNSEIGPAALYWNAAEVSRYLRVRCLSYAPPRFSQYLQRVWHEILDPFFKGQSVHLKGKAALQGELADVDAIWAPYGPSPNQMIPITDVCSAIAFVLSITLPPVPPEDWLSVAAVFVHFCRVTHRSTRPARVHILWKTAPHDHSPGSHAGTPMILIDDILLNTTATPASPPSAPPDASSSRKPPTRDEDNRIFRLQRLDELLQEHGFNPDQYLKWPLPMEVPRLSMMNGSAQKQPNPNARHPEKNTRIQQWPGCSCSTFVPVIHAINQGGAVTGVSFDSVILQSLLKQYKRHEVFHSSVKDGAAIRCCETCRYLLKRVGVAYQDVTDYDLVREPRSPLVIPSSTVQPIAQLHNDPFSSSSDSQNEPSWRKRGIQPMASGASHSQSSFSIAQPRPPPIYPDDFENQAKMAGSTYFPSEDGRAWSHSPAPISPLRPDKGDVAPISPIVPLSKYSGSRETNNTLNDSDVPIYKPPSGAPPLPDYPIPGAFDQTSKPGPKGTASMPMRKSALKTSSLPNHQPLSAPTTVPAPLTGSSNPASINGSTAGFPGYPPYFQATPSINSYYPYAQGTAYPQSQAQSSFLQSQSQAQGAPLQIPWRNSSPFSPQFPAALSASYPYPMAYYPSSFAYNSPAPLTIPATGTQKSHSKSTASDTKPRGLSILRR